MRTPSGWPDGPSRRAQALQLDVAKIFFSLDTASDFLVAGGAALVASNLIVRPTEDLDLSAATPTTSITEAKDAFAQVLQERGCDVVIVQDEPMSCRMIVARPVEETLVDLAIDSPPRSRPTITILGPTLAPVELAGRKLVAPFGRMPRAADTAAARLATGRQSSQRDAAIGRRMRELREERLLVTPWTFRYAAQRDYHWTVGPRR